MSRIPTGRRRQCNYGSTKPVSSLTAGQRGSSKNGPRSCSDMLHEFAIDPATLSTWQSYRYTVEKFGVEHGRLIALFPKHWRERVIQACAGCKPIEKHR